MAPRRAAASRAAVLLPEPITPVVTRSRGRRSGWAKRAASREQRPRLGRALGVVGDLEAQHLAPHPRAVGAVEVEQRHRLVVAGLLEIGVEKADGEVRAPEPFEVHGEERDLPGDVTEPEAVVELDAVEDLHGLDAAHVLGLQVAVTVAALPGGHARGEARRLARRGTRRHRRARARAWRRARSPARARPSGRSSPPSSGASSRGRRARRSRRRSRPRHESAPPSRRSRRAARAVPRRALTRVSSMRSAGSRRMTTATSMARPAPPKRGARRVPLMSITSR